MTEDGAGKFQCAVIDGLGWIGRGDEGNLDSRREGLVPDAWGGIWSKGGGDPPAPHAILRGIGRPNEMRGMEYKGRDSDSVCCNIL
jgi:hypothetical protein